MTLTPSPSGVGSSGTRVSSWTAAYRVARCRASASPSPSVETSASSAQHRRISLLDYDSGRNRFGHPRFVLPMGQPNKTVDEYRKLAEKCRETARMILGENERSRLLEMAQVWDLIADRVGRAAPSISGAVH